MLKYCSDLVQSLNHSTNVLNTIARCRALCKMDNRIKINYIELQFLVLSNFKVTAPANLLQFPKNLATHKINRDELLQPHNAF